MADLEAVGGTDTTTTQAQPSSNPTNLGGGTGAGGVSDNTVIQAQDLTDDTLVKYQGQTVKYGDLSKRLQADYTRKTQQAENLRRQVLKQQSEIAAERKRLEGIAASLVSRQGNGQGQGQGQVDPFMAELGAAEFIDGKTAVKLVQALHDTGFAPIASAIKERDKVITQLYQHVVQLTNTVKEMGGRFGNQDFEGKINNWLKEGGYPPEAADLAKEIYLAYDGDDLDQEFPQIFQNRWNQIQTIIENQRKAKVDAARRAPVLPGRGGNGSAAKPIGLKGNESAKTIADQLWDAIQAGDQT